MSDQPIIDPTARLSYAGVGLPDDVTGPPLPLLRRWWADAVADDRIVEPDAMVVATVDDAGHPDARLVLLKDMRRNGFTFFTHTTSAKGEQLAGVPYASLVLLWHPMHRQVRVRGPVTPVARAPSSKEPWPTSRPAGPTPGRRPTYRCRRTGAATSFARTPSSSGSASPHGCTTGSCSPVRVLVTSTTCRPGR